MMQNEKTPPLRMVFWETTAGCNLSCSHCRRLEVSKKLSKNDLNQAQAEEVVRQIAKAGKPILVLSGGEPLMRPDIFSLVSLARSCDLEVALASNGTMIDEPTALKLKNTGVRRVSISLDGPCPDIHDRFRGQTGSFEKALSGCRALRKASISLQINTTLTQNNVDQAGAIYDLACSLGADSFHVFMLVPVGCGLQIAESQQLEGQRYEEILKWLYQKSLEKKIHIRATCAPHYFRIMRQEALRCSEDFHFEKTGFHAMTRGCLAGSSICFISHEGHIFPCGYLPLSCGKVPENSLENVWRDSLEFKKLRNPGLLKGKCGVCEFKSVCMGCRARAYYQTGDFLNEEPFCIYEPRLQSLKTSDGAKNHD